MPRSHGNHSDVIHAFFHWNEYPYNGGNIFHHKDYLYSYGEHFWLAYRHRDKKTGKITYLLNGDYYSVTTRCHQSKAQQAAPNRQSLTISAEALAAADIDPETMVIKDRTQDINKSFHHNVSKEVAERDGNNAEIKDFDLFIREVERAASDFVKSAPAGATVFYETRRFYPNPEDRSEIKKLTLPRDYHRPASALLFRPRKKAQRFEPDGSGHYPYGQYVDYFKPAAYFICGMDDNQYFISELPGRPQDVDQAFEALKPAVVKEAEQEGRDIERQGEWFFIHRISKGREARALYKQMHMNYDLTDASDGEGASHTATRGALANELLFHNGHKFKGDALLVSGQIRHSTHEHPMLGLSYAKQPEIWQAACNTAKNSWSMGGNVD